MALDSRFVVAFPLQELFRDKDTGLPLRNGKLKFFEDKARTTPKDVYTLTGSPGSYTYSNAGSVITLNSAGYVTTTIYYFPFTDTPDDSDGTLDLYYVEIRDENDAIQNTRDAVPNTTITGEDSGENLENFIPNGQFTAHTDLPDKGKMSTGTTDIAFGGWQFVKDSGSTTDDFVTFLRDATYTEDPERSPRYRLRTRCDAVNSGGDTDKGFRVKFPDVNKFADATQEFTIKFSARSLSAGPFNIEVIVIKDYGTGGQTQDKIPIGSAITINTSFEDHFVQFSFGDNDNKNIGPNDDDFVAILIKVPQNSVYDLEITDFVLVLGDVSNPSFPYESERQSISQSVGGSFPVPAKDGSDIGLPIILTRTGLEYDDSMVATIYTKAHGNATIKDGFESICDGTSFDFEEFTSAGIPYSRAGNKLLGSSIPAPLWGTGRDNMTAWTTTSNADYVYVTNNKLGSVTAADAGTSSFTVDVIHTGANYSAIAYRYGATNKFVIELTAFGVPLASPSNGDSGFTHTIIQTGTSLLKEKVEWTVTAPPAAGKFFKWSNTATTYYVWYRVDGVGADPMAGGTGIRVDIRSTDTAEDVMIKTRLAVNGFQETSVLCVAGASITAGDYWDYDTTDFLYRFWYTVDGVGTAPADGGRKLKQIDVGSGDTAATVATTTRDAMLKTRFATPDFRGMFLRGRDSGAGVDPDVATRYQLYNVKINGDNVGTVQESANLSHRHGNDDVIVPGAALNSGANTGTAVMTPSGGKESRPTNAYVTYVFRF